MQDKILIRPASAIDKEFAKICGNGYYFDETDGNIYWSGEYAKFLAEFEQQFPWSITI